MTQDFALEQAYYMSPTKNNFKKYAGFLLLSITPLIIFFGDVFPEYIKSRPALMFFIDELLIVASVFIFGISILSPLFCKVINKVQISDGKITKFNIRNVFSIILVWCIMLMPAFHLILDLKTYHKMENVFTKQSQDSLIRIEATKNSNDIKKIFKKIVVVSYKKNLSLPIPDGLVDSKQTITKGCDLDISREYCKGSKISSIFSIKKMDLIKHLTYAWTPKLPYSFISPDNEMAKSLIVREVNLTPSKSDKIINRK